MSEPIIPEGVILYRNLDELVTWKGNYNQGDVGGIYEAIKTFGYNRSISVWQDNIVMAGNHTLLALRYLLKDWKTNDLDKVPEGSGIVVRDKQWFVLVSDCSHLQFEKAKAYAIADNAWARKSVADERLLVQYLTDVRQYEGDSGEQLIDATGYDELEIELLAALINDDYNSDLDELGEQYGESGMTDDEINSEAVTKPLKKIELRISEPDFQSWVKLMNDAPVSEWSERFVEIIGTVVWEDLSWFQD